MAGTLPVLMKKLEHRLVDVLPDGVQPARFLRVMRFVITSTKDVDACTQSSVVSSAMECARLGLIPGRDAHFIPLKPKSGPRECHLWIDYRGFQKLACRSGNVRTIEARIVYRGDAFAWQEGTDPHIDHRPDVNTSRADADVLAVYAVAQFSDGGTTFLVMTPEEVEHVRAKSRSKDKGPWVTDWQAMARKTVIKQLCDKRLVLDDDMVERAIEIDNRFETGRVTRALTDDDPEDTTRLMAGHTADRMAELKERIATAPATDTEEATS